MTYADVAKYAVLAFLSGFTVGFAWGAVTSFVRAILH